MPDATPMPGSTLHALCVYAEPLVAGRRIVVFGDASLRLGERFLDLGARVVHLYDPHAPRAAAAAERAPRGLTVLPLPPGDFDVRDGAFDLAVIVDIADIASPGTLLARVRRLIAPGGAALVRSLAVPADGRARPRPGSLDYEELYDLVAMQFAHVRMVGQLAWNGVALAELGGDGAEPDVTVDTQLVTEAAAPEAFVALGSQEGLRLAEYALVQVPTPPATEADGAGPRASDRADLAAAQLRASLLEAQIEELRAQRNHEGVSHADALASAEAELADRLSDLQRVDARAADALARAEEAAGLLRKRDEDLARLRDRAALVAKELDEERRDRAAFVARELDGERQARARIELELTAARAKVEAVAKDTKALLTAAARAPALEVALAQLEARAADLAGRLQATDEARVGADRERARLEGALAAAMRQLEALAAGGGDGHEAEHAAFEGALRERARVIHALEVELVRRERIILDLVHALEEARAAGGEHAGDLAAAQGDPRLRAALDDAEAALKDTRLRAERMRAENDALREKLNAAALEIARREAESATSTWRIQELEQAVGRLEDEQSELTMTIPPPAFQKVDLQANDVTVLAQRLSAAEDEVDILRQALAQEHEARVRAESGDALAQARAELARQASLLEKLSGELEAGDAKRRPASATDDSGAGAV